MPYGWTGKLLRLNLTTKTASIEDNKYNEEWLGGMGLGYAIIHDEVPVGTDPAAPEMKMVMAAGPLTGAGVAMALPMPISVPGSHRRSTKMPSGSASAAPSSSGFPGRRVAFSLSHAASIKPSTAPTSE